MSNDKRFLVWLASIVVVLLMGVGVFSTAVAGQGNEKAPTHADPDPVPAMNSVSSRCYFLPVVGGYAQGYDTLEVDHNEPAYDMAACQQPPVPVAVATATAVPTEVPESCEWEDGEWDCDPCEWVDGHWECDDSIP